MSETSGHTIKSQKSSREVCLVSPDLVEVCRCPLEGMNNFLVTDTLSGQHTVPVAGNVVIFVDPDFLHARCVELIDRIREVGYHRVKIIILSARTVEKSDFPSVPADLIHLILPVSLSCENLRNIVHSTLEILKLYNERLDILDALGHSHEEIQRLTSVGQSISSERNLDRLIPLILDHARELVGADSGSIYVTERDSDGKPVRIRFKKSSLTLEENEFTLPINKNSIAGYVAYSGDLLVIDDVYSLTGAEGYRFNDEFDRKHGYYCRSMMVIPMKNHRGDVLGVIQLINRKSRPDQPLTLDGMKGSGVTTFTLRDQELAMAMASQAAVAIENNQLIQDIQNLFEGFVRASVSAIEQRDPTTSGHSFRVAEFSIGIAEALTRNGIQKFGMNDFSSEQMRELRYAALLHDFGKVGVREHILVKAQKLYPYELTEIQWRFRYMKKQYENDLLRKKVAYLKQFGQNGFPAYEASIENDFIILNSRLLAAMQDIELANEPSILESQAIAHLQDHAKILVQLDDGNAMPFLNENELVSLSVKRGNLNDEERMQIMLHVSNTYAFLIQIPWTGDLRGIPDIALGHHEKLDGTGYPLGLEAMEIPVQTRIMTIADIFDALTARDRPYKKELAPELALKILEEEAKQGKLDSDLLRVFIEAGVFRKIETMKR